MDTGQSQNTDQANQLVNSVIEEFIKELDNFDIELEEEIKKTTDNA